MKSRWLMWTVVGALGLGARGIGACGNDGAAPPTEAGTDFGMDSGGTRTVTVVDDSMPPTTLMCGSNTCTAPAFGAGSLPDGGLGGFQITPALLSMAGASPEVCCAGDGGAQCGVTGVVLGGMCIEQDQVGEPDTECPNITVNLMGIFSFPLMGCCKVTNQCGFDLSIVGVGCLERTAAAGLDKGDAGGVLGMTLSMSSGALGDGGPIESVPCNYGGTGADGGTQDAASDTGTDGGTQDAAGG